MNTKAQFEISWDENGELHRNTLHSVRTCQLCTDSPYLLCLSADPQRDFKNFCQAPTVGAWFLCAACARSQDRLW